MMRRAVSSKIQQQEAPSRIMCGVRTFPFVGSIRSTGPGVTISAHNCCTAAPLENQTVPGSAHRKWCWTGMFGLVAVGCWAVQEVQTKVSLEEDELSMLGAIMEAGSQDPERLADACTALEAVSAKRLTDLIHTCTFNVCACASVATASISWWGSSNKKSVDANAKNMLRNLKKGKAKSLAGLRKTSSGKKEGYSAREVRAGFAIANSLLIGYFDGLDAGVRSLFQDAIFEGTKAAGHAYFENGSDAVIDPASRMVAGLIISGYSFATTGDAHRFWNDQAANAGAAAAGGVAVVVAAPAGPLVQVPVTMASSWLGRECVNWGFGLRAPTAYENRQRHIVAGRNAIEQDQGQQDFLGALRRYGDGDVEEGIKKLHKQMQLSA